MPDVTTPDAPSEGRGRTEPVDIDVEMQRSYLDYAMSVIVGRALPDVRDGLKPVHIRILYAMYDGGYRPDRGYFKCARVVGDVMGNYHPHGDSAIYDTLVRMAQPWAMRMPLIDGQGNFGSPGNDPAAAMRYTECRLTPAGHGDAAGHRQGDRRFPPELRRPVRRAGRPAGPVPEPAGQRLGGHRGGMATKIPPHNLREVAAGAQWYLSNFEATDEELLEALLERIKGPDFPTAGADRRPPRHPGRLPHRPRLDHHARGGRGGGGPPRPDQPGRHRAALPGQPGHPGPEDRRAGREGRITGIADVRDESSARTGQRLVIVLKRDAVAKVVLNNLYKHTQLQDTFGANMLALVDGVPRTLRLDQMIRYWVSHQIEVIVRRTQYLLRKAQERAHILSALLKAIDQIDAVIALIRASESAAAAQQGLMDLLDIDEIQARAILDMQLRRLAALERQQLIDEYEELMAQIAEYEAILASPERQRQIVSTELGRDHRASTATTGGPRSSPTTATCRSRTSSPRRTSSSRSPAAATPSGPRPTCTGRSGAAARACAARSCGPTTSSTTSS